MAQATLSETQAVSRTETVPKTGAAFPRGNNFNFLRFALAVLVIFSHSFSLMRGSDKWDWLYILTRGQVFGGGLAVEGFFVISGFLILHSWLNSKTPADYLKKRVLRIYPGYVVCALLCIFVVGPIAVGSASVYFHTMPWKQNLHAILFLNQIEIHPFTYLPIQIMNGSLWTISVEFFCYVALAALGLLGVLRQRSYVFSLFVVLLAVYAVKTWRGWGTAFCFPLHLGGNVNEWPRLLTFFLAGMCCYFYRERLRFNPGGLVVSLFVLAVSCVTNSLALTLPLFGTYLLFYFAFHPKINLHEFGRKIDLSYGIYLYAWPIQELLLKYFFHNLNPLTLFLCALPLSCAAAYLSWTLVEKPFLKLKPRRQAAPASL